MKKIFQINLISFLIYFFSWGLYRLGFPYLVYLAGFIFFFLPGLNLALIGEQLTTSRQGLVKLCLWAWLNTIILNPAIIFFVSKISRRIAFESDVQLWFVMFWFISLGSLFFAYSFRKFPPTQIKLPSIASKKNFYLAIIIFIGFLVCNFFLYRYIPESDPYSCLISLKESIALHAVPKGEGRPLFLVLSWMFLFVTKIPAYWFYKIIIPLFSFVIVMVFGKYNRQDQKSILEIFGNILFLCFPVVAMEILISRPQSIFLFSLPVVIFLVSELNKKKVSGNFLWLSMLLLMSFIGMKFHPLFIILVALTIIIIFEFMFRFFWQELLAKIGIFSFIVGLISAIFFLKIPETLSGVYAGLTHGLPPLHFSWWFIGNYINSDGVQVGWPGLSALLYYGYNLGLLPVVVLFFLFGRKLTIRWNLNDNWPYFIVFGLFLVVAEILPRFGLAFLPDRAWLFLSLITGLLVLKLISWRFDEFTRIDRIFFYTLIVISLTLSFVVTYAKQGWVSVNEYQAALWLKNNTGSDAIIISQPGNLPMIEYFAERKFGVFGSRIKVKSNNNIYIVYSNDKFKGLYGEREWWRKWNYFDIRQFDSKKKIYEKNGISIWRY